MAKNKKCQSAGVRFGPALKAFVICLLIGGSAVGYVWQKNQIFQLGQQIKLRETRLRQLLDHKKKLEQNLQSMRTTAYLEKRIKDLNLGLGPPAAAQVFTLPEPARELARPGAETQVAQGRGP